MKKYDIVIIGASAAGRTAAITARRHYPDKSILVIRKEEKTLIPCGIPYIFGQLGETSKNLMPDAPYAANGIDLLNDEVTLIDSDKKSIICFQNGSIAYDRLILSTGSRPIKLPIDGIEKENVFFIHKNVEYLDDFLQKLRNFKDVVIIGGGFIGVEFAEEIKRNRKINVNIIEKLSHCLKLNFDEEFAEVAKDILNKEKINIIAQDEVAQIMGEEKIEKVRLKSGKEIIADALIVAVGSTPNVDLAEKIGLEMGETRGIKVNHYMQTSQRDIYACGDCSEDKSFFTGMPVALKLASIAAMQARICAANLFGTKRVDPGAIGVFSTKLGDTTFASAGLTEDMAKNLLYKTVIGISEGINRHPGALPGSAKIKLKLVFEKASRVLIGGQILGAESAGELINVISACIQKRMTANDIATFQTGTHPLLTASPVAYQLNNAAEIAHCKMLCKN